MPLKVEKKVPRGLVMTGEVLSQQKLRGGGRASGPRRGRKGHFVTVNRSTKSQVGACSGEGGRGTQGRTVEKRST